MSLAIVEASVLACLGRIGFVVFHWCEWAKTNNQKTYENPIHCPWGMQRKLSTSLNFWFPFASSVVFFGRANWKEQRNGNNSVLDYASTCGVPIFKERSGQWEIALLLLTETPSPDVICVLELTRTSDDPCLFLSKKNTLSYTTELQGEHWFQGLCIELLGVKWAGFSSAISACEKNGHWQIALNILTESLSSKRSATVIGWTFFFS